MVRFFRLKKISILKNIDFTNPYKVIKLLMLQPTEFLKLNDKIKSNHYFLLNRILSQKFPKVAQNLNQNGINTATCMDFYANVFIVKRYKRLPGWVYTKFASKHKKKKSLDRNFIIWLKQKKFYNDYEINHLLEFYPNDIKKLKKEYNVEQANI